MSEWITPDEVKEHHDNGYDAGVAHERERIIALLEAECVCEPMRGDDGNCALCYSVALIKGENE